MAVSALPFGYEYAARECFQVERISTPEEVVRAQVDAARRFVPEGARWVIVAHTFVAGANKSEAERPIARVGGIETVGVDVFDGAHYVALGQCEPIEIEVSRLHERGRVAFLVVGIRQARPWRQLRQSERLTNDGLLQASGMQGRLTELSCSTHENLVRDADHARHAAHVRFGAGPLVRAFDSALQSNPAAVHFRGHAMTRDRDNEAHLRLRREYPPCRAPSLWIERMYTRQKQQLWQVPKWILHTTTARVLIAQPCVC